jgi:carbamoyltransferase
MKILSIYPYTHISSAAIIINGRIIAAAPEERFNRIKMSTEFPMQAINWCLSYSNTKWEELDYVVIPWNPSINTQYSSSRWTSSMVWRGEMFSHIPIQIMRAINDKREAFFQKKENLFENNTMIEIGKIKIVFIKHHVAHAASAFFLSPFKNSDILTIDGHGEEDTCFIGKGVDTEIFQSSLIKYPHSLGLFYGTFTDFLGFTPDVDEWKVMALSSYSKKENRYDNKIKKLINFSSEGFELDLNYFNYYTFDRKKNFFTDKLCQFIGTPRNKEEKLSIRHYEIAGALQRTFSRSVDHLLTIAKRKGGKSGNIVLAGGAAMNCVYNGTLYKNKLYKKSFIPFCADDLGVSVGAALYLNNKIKKISKKFYLNASFGPDYSNEFIKNELKKFKANFIQPENLCDYIANKISNGKLIGWFQGRMEFGHRALGNRSILADPRNPDMKRIINEAVKFREGFRPFAPAVLDEFLIDIFEIPKEEKIYYMERAVYVKKNWRKRIPAVTHVDGTARVQTVTKASNKQFYSLISSFYKITNVPVLINTSFNLNGEPIVMSPEHAIRTFYSCGLDTLVIGNYVINKKND